MHINCRLAGSGWISLKIISKNEDQFMAMKDALARDLVVFKYDPQTRGYLTTAYEFERLNEVCNTLDIDMNASPKFQLYLKKFYQWRNRIEEAKEDKSFDIPYWRKDKDVQPHDYQKTTINLITEARRFLLGDDMGVGKTPQALGIIFNSFKKYGYEKALILCPLSLSEQWKEEILKFTTFPQERVHIIDQHVCKTGELEDGYVYRHCHGSKANDIPPCKFFEDCRKEQDKNFYRRKQISESSILISNYHKMDKYKNDIKKAGYDIFILDEAKEIKNPQSAKTKAVAEITSANPYSVVVPMSATLIENEMKDLFSVMNVANPLVFGKYTSFRDKFLIVDHYNNVTGAKQVMLPLLKTVVDQHLIRRTLNEVWKERPSITQIIRYCEMGKHQQSLYDIARSQKLTDIDDVGAKSINNAMMATLIGYLLQICDTTKTIEPKTPPKADTSCKMVELRRIIDEELPEGTQLIVFSRFGKKVVPHIVKELKQVYGKKNVTSITGSQSGEQRNKRFRRFKKGNVKILVCSDALAYGANMQFCNYLVNYDLPWNPAVLWQRIGRIYRRGQKKAVTVINLFIKGTFEEDLYNILKSKQQLSSDILAESEMQESSKGEQVDLRDLMKFI